MITIPTGPHKLESLGYKLPRLLDKWRAMFVIAERVANLSVVVDKKVGCVMFDTLVTRILAFGYNGPATGIDHDSAGSAYVMCPDCRADCLDPALCSTCEGQGHIPNPAPSGDQHAEVNALFKLPRDVPALSMVVAITCAPCATCSRHLVQSGRVGAVLFQHSDYGKYDPDFLPAHGIATGGWEDVQRVREHPEESEHTVRLQMLIDTLLTRSK